MKPPVAMAQIVITVFEDGRLNLSAPPDQILCYGMLELAKDAVRKRTLAEANGKLQAVDGRPALAVHGVQTQQ